MAWKIKANGLGKYPHKRVVRDGIVFGSMREADRFSVLRLMEKQGEIHGLIPHPYYPLIVNGVKLGRITFDAGYLTGKKIIVEEVKSSGTVKERSYRFRVKLFKALYPNVELREIVPGSSKKLGDWIQARPLKAKAA